MRLNHAHKERRKVNIGESGRAIMRHVKEIAQQRVQPCNLLEDRFKRVTLPRVVAAGKRVLGFEAHRCDRIADFMREAGRHAPDSGKPFARRRACPLFCERFAGRVQRVNETVKLLFACARQRWKIDRVWLPAP